MDSDIDESSLVFVEEGRFSEKILLKNSQIGKMVPYYIFDAIKANYAFGKVIDEDSHVQERHLKLYFQIWENGKDQ